MPTLLDSHFHADKTALWAKLHMCVTNGDIMVISNIMFIMFISNINCTQSMLSHSHHVDIVFHTFWFRLTSTFHHFTLHLAYHSSHLVEPSEAWNRKGIVRRNGLEELRICNIFQYLDQHYSMRLPYHSPHPPLTTAGANTLHHKAINTLVQTKTYYLVRPKNYCTRGMHNMHCIYYWYCWTKRNINTL